MTKNASKYINRRTRKESSTDMESASFKTLKTAQDLTKITWGTPSCRWKWGVKHSPHIRNPQEIIKH